MTKWKNSAAKAMIYKDIIDGTVPLAPGAGDLGAREPL
jgi:hypothetical protein